MRPNYVIKDIFGITDEMLQDIKLIICDLDNTLAAYYQDYIDEQVVNWINYLTNREIKFLLVTNNKQRRAAEFIGKHQIDFIASAKKPLPFVYKKIMRKYQLKPQQILAIGDQLLTDVLGANLVKIKTVLVNPVVEKDLWLTYLNRRIEKILLKLMRIKRDE